jgi:hypothetical protein
MYVTLEELRSMYTLTLLNLRLRLRLRNRSLG